MRIVENISNESTTTSNNARYSITDKKSAENEPVKCVKEIERSKWSEDDEEDLENSSATEQINTAFNENKKQSTN